MSVLVKGMKMPENCWECRMTTDAGFCSAMPKEFCGYADDELNRPKWCPLVELPEKHGDLIDRNDLKKEYAMGFDCNNCVSNQKSCEHDAFYAKMDFCLMLDDASVVIEAEDEG